MRGSNMGMYTWLSTEEFERFSYVTDKELNELLADVRDLMPEVYISERVEIKRSWWGRETHTTRYTIYNRCRPDLDEVHHMNLPSGNAGYVANYLYGLINGYHKCLKYGNAEN